MHCPWNQDGEEIDVFAVLDEAMKKNTELEELNRQLHCKVDDLDGDVEHWQDALTDLQIKYAKLLKYTEGLEERLVVAWKHECHCLEAKFTEPEQSTASSSAAAASKARPGSKRKMLQPTAKPMPNKNGGKRDPPDQSAAAASRNLTQF